jgi:hypothetical protein
MSVELAVLTPILVLLMLLVALGGRLVEARGAIDGAARDAARAASLARYPGSQGPLGATTLAEQAAAGDLTGYCTGGNLSVSVAPGTFPPLGQSAQLGDNVTVTVTCTINTSVFGPLGLHSADTMTATAVAPLDPYMCRGLQCAQ